MSATQALLTSPHSAELITLAQELDENKVTPGVLGFIVFAVMGLAVWMLMKSLNRHMNRVDFKEPEAADTAKTAQTAQTTQRPEA
ncbi:hypothetical protein JJV70_07165 [Streptomyces sp. JJ66]|uniref:hypothetical protein n=1 Tax=Streptomyces sp. JJ66 TaxID=2803843 RepID=UPI001C57BEA6|nr:hypothetical protein [Streptomyces sp. JJ66]MBW1601892.1 hypothetical protein [Streptomyces sp. JJ66]